MRQLLLRLTFHIALVVGWWQIAAAQEACVLDTLFTGEGESRPVTLVPTRAGTLFILDRSGEVVHLVDLNGRVRTFLRQRDPLHAQERFSALAVHPQYPDSPFVYILLTHPTRPAILVHCLDSASVGVAVDTVWSAPESGTAAAVIRPGPHNTLMLLLRDGGEQGAPSHGKSTHVVFVPLSSEGGEDQAEAVETEDRDVINIVYDPSAGLFYCIERPEADPRAERSLAVYDDPELDDPVRRVIMHTGNGRPLAMSTLALYNGDAFPRLAGRFIATGRGTTALWHFRPSATMDTDTASMLLSHGYGFSDVAVSPEGTLYGISGPYDNAVVLRIRPSMPQFLSVPPDTAWEDREYRYTPLCGGTAPILSLLNAPPGMILDTLSSTVTWMPRQEHVGDISALLQARNGAGVVEQRISVHVMNVNDPPSPPALLLPDQAVLPYVDVDPVVLFSWKRSTDADGDTIRYTLQIDSLADFSSTPPLKVITSTTDSERVTLPPHDGVYHWRVLASDGTLTTVSEPALGTFRIAFTRTEKEKRERRVDAPSAGPVLEQNFPNPFNPTTSIKYTIPQSGHVRLSVFNLLGQELGVIFQGNQSEGTHEVEFSVDSLPSGIYFYRIQAPGLVETKKMVITR